MASPTAIIHQLNQARRIVLADPKIYPQVVPGVLNVIASNAHLDLRRWGADFLAETFASPVLAPDEKQKLCLHVLETLRGYLARKEDVGEEEDPAVLKSAVQCAASVYPYVFRHTVVNAQDTQTWALMAGIKSAILRRMDSAAAGVRICCIKFVARVVQTQTPGLIADPRRPEQNEISLALVPREHPTIPPVNLEAEASGLLDRLLGVLQDNDTDALVVTATLNSLSTLVQRRASVSTKILMTVLNFNPLRLASTPTPLTGKDKITLKSMTRTTMSFLVNVLKRNPNHQLALRLQQRTEQLRHSLTEVFSENSSGLGKRKDHTDGIEPRDGLDDAKRRRIEVATTNGTSGPQQQQQPQIHPQPNYPPLPPGPITIAQLFTLTQDPSAAGFHVGPIPQQIVAQLVPPLLQSIDQKRFDDAINAVRARVLQLDQRPPVVDSALAAARAASGEDAGDDDYDPDNNIAGFEAHDQVRNQLSLLPPQGPDDAAPVAMPVFALPPGPPLTEEMREGYSKMALQRVFGTLGELDREAKVAAASGKKKVGGDGGQGFMRLAGGGGLEGREGWLTLVIRLATRAPFGLEGGEEEDAAIKREGEARGLVVKGGKEGFELAKGIREALCSYVVDDFRRRIDVGIAWLCEEWYADRMALRRRREEAQRTKRESSNGNNGDADDDDDDDTTPPAPSPDAPSSYSDEVYYPNYTPLSLHLLRTLSPYLDVKDGRHLIRLLSEIPHLSPEHIEEVRKIGQDPERLAMATQCLTYLALVRPPVREVVVGVGEGMWRESLGEDGGGTGYKGLEGLMRRWRPEVLVKGEEGEGGKVEVVKGEAEA